MARRQEDEAMVTRHGNGMGNGPAMRLEARAERTLIRPRDSFRHVDFRITVGTVERAASEQHDPTVMHWVGLHHATRAQMEAPDLSRTGDMDGARHRLRSVARRIERYAAGDADLLQALRELAQAEHELQDREVYRERYYRAQTAARGLRDLRGPGGSR